MAALEERMAKEGFWEDKETAQKVIKEAQGLKQLLEPMGELGQGLEDLETLAELAKEDASAEQEFVAEMAKMEQRLRAFEFRQMMSGPMDKNNAYLSVHAGAGGTESCDWAQMLLRMYTRWAEDHRMGVTLIDELGGEEAGIRQATILVKGPYAYGYLRAEMGIHRLVRISPFDANKRRHTSFAAVDVTPEVEDDIEIEIKDADIQMETYRSSGAGGQKVNKTSSAVRLYHIPTGIVVSCQVERSQFQNRAQAMNMLKAKLYQMEEAKREAELSKAYNDKGEIAWGNQIRSYVLQPYQMVKDLRTDEETGNVQAVLDGGIDRFIEAYLKQMVGAKKA